MEIPIDVRKECYEYVLSFIEKEMDGCTGGFCWMFYKALKLKNIPVIKYDDVLPYFPELMTYKPSRFWKYTVFWFSPNDMETRKGILKDILGKLTV
jgi:hypothetical protein